MWESILSVAAPTVLTSAALWWLVRSSTSEPSVEGDLLVLRYPRAFEAAGWVICALGVALVGWLASMWGVPTVGDALAAAALLGFFCAAGALFIVGARREWVHVRRDGLTGQTAFGREPVRLDWKDVAGVQFGALSGYLTVSAHDGRKVRASAFLIGAAELASLLERQFPEQGGMQSAADLRQFRAGL